MSVPLGALVSKSRRMTLSSCSSVSMVDKSSSGMMFEGNTMRPCRFTTKDFMVDPFLARVGSVAGHPALDVVHGLELGGHLAELLGADGGTDVVQPHPQVRGVDVAVGRPARRRGAL